MTKATIIMPKAILLKNVGSIKDVFSMFILFEYNVYNNIENNTEAAPLSGGGFCVTIYLVNPELKPVSQTNLKLVRIT